jgi:hypothetical protein
VTSDAGKAAKGSVKVECPCRHYRSPGLYTQYRSPSLYNQNISQALLLESALPFVISRRDAVLTERSPK